MYDQHCLYRRWALAALDGVGIPYRIAYFSQRLTGIQAAVKAGLAVAPLGAASIPEGSRILGEAEGFPPLPTGNLTLLRGRSRTEPVARPRRTLPPDGPGRRLNPGRCRAQGA